MWGLIGNFEFLHRKYTIYEVTAPYLTQWSSDRQSSMVEKCWFQISITVISCLLRIDVSVDAFEKQEIEVTQFASKISHKDINFFFNENDNVKSKPNKTDEGFEFELHMLANWSWPVV